MNRNFEQKLSMLSSVGQRNNLTQTVLLGLHEALLEFVYLTNGCTSDSCHLVGELFRGYQVRLFILSIKMNLFKNVFRWCSMLKKRRQRKRRNPSKHSFGRTPQSCSSRRWQNLPSLSLSTACPAMRSAKTSWSYWCWLTFSSQAGLTVLRSKPAFAKHIYRTLHSALTSVCFFIFYEVAHYYFGSYQTLEPGTIHHIQML